MTHKGTIILRKGRREQEVYVREGEADRALVTAASDQRSSFDVQRADTAERERQKQAGRKLEAKKQGVRLPDAGPRTRAVRHYDKPGARSSKPQTHEQKIKRLVRAIHEQGRQHLLDELDIHLRKAADLREALDLVPLGQGEKDL